MLHVWPRLAWVQEQREALGIASRFPDLNRLTACAAILPVVTPDGVSFRVVSPDPERISPPFYVERLLEETARSLRGVSAPNLTHAEQIAAGLLARAERDGVVQPFHVTRLRPARGHEDELPASRAAMFHAAIRSADVTVQALLRQVIDPTRQDSAQAHDPFVQTTIYAIAPLVEPLASALIWPILAELVATLRSRHVARVVGILCTGSFAQDETRAVEEATVYVTLADLEALTGVRGRDRDGAAFRKSLGVYGPEWAGRVGHKLFDTVYLIDREKSNQALARSSYELSVLAGNALEAFLVADDTGYIEQCLGPEADASRSFPYSIVGAATDYIPLPEYIAATVEEEQKQVIRSEVLAAGSRERRTQETFVAVQESAPLSAAETASRTEPDISAVMPQETFVAVPERLEDGLHQLHAAPEEAIGRFFGATGKPLFDTGATAANAGEGDARPGWLPKPRIAQRYILPETFKQELRDAEDLSEWQNLVDAREREVTAELEKVSTAAQDAWGLEGRPFGLLPDATRRAAEVVVQDIRSAPNGIDRARGEVAGWIREVEAVLRDLEAESPPSGVGNQALRDLEGWRWEFAVAAESYPTLLSRARSATILLAIVGLLLLPALFLLGDQASWNQGQRLLTAGGGLVLLLILILSVWLAATQRVRRLKRQRIGLLADQLSQTAQRSLHAGLLDFYRRLHEELGRLQAALQDAVAELQDWSRADEQPDALPAGVGEPPLRVAQADGQVWQQVRECIKAQSAAGANSREAFRHLWQGDGPAPESQTEADRLVKRLRAALGAQSGLNGPDESLANIFRDYAARATRYLTPGGKLLAGQKELVQAVAAQHSIERRLFDRGKPASGRASGDVPDPRIAFVEDMILRAKPSANYEVAYNLSPNVLEVDFALTPSGGDSRLRSAFEQRNFPLLVSQDPLSISAVRTVSRLALPDLALAERCSREYAHLSAEKRRALDLVPGKQ